jgi:hypothetical protein
VPPFKFEGFLTEVSVQGQRTKGQLSLDYLCGGEIYGVAQSRNHHKFQIFKRDQQNKVTANFYSTVDFTLKLFLTQQALLRFFHLSLRQHSSGQYSLA